MKTTLAGYCNRAGLIGLIVLVTGCGPDVPPGELAHGQEPYLRHCASCHGDDGAGKPPAFPPLAGSEWLELGPEAVALITLYGLRGEIEVAGRRYRGFMPPMHHLADEDIVALLAYIGTAWADWSELPDAADIEQLRGVRSRRQPLEGLGGVKQALEEIDS